MQIRKEGIRRKMKIFKCTIEFSYIITNLFKYSLPRETIPTLPFTIPQQYPYLRDKYRGPLSLLSFFPVQSNMVLTPGEGLQNYVWSVRSTASNVYGNDVLREPK